MHIFVRAAAFSLAGVCVFAAGCTAGCTRETPINMWVDGFQPENVRFEVEDLGPQTGEALQALRRRPDIDGALLLPPGSCPDGGAGGCRAAIVSVFVHNKSAEKEPPPVIRLVSPAGKEARHPIAFQATDIDPGRIGRLRWVVEMWPDEKDLTATLSASVRLEVSAPPTPPAPPAPPAEAPGPPANK